MEGNTVVASAGSDDKVKYVIDELGAHAAFNYRTEGLTAGLARVAPEGIDVSLTAWAVTIWMPR